MNVSSMKFVPMILATAAFVFVAASPAEKAFGFQAKAGKADAKAEVKGDAKAKAKGKGGGSRIQTTIVASGLNHPWSMAWLPNGDILVTERVGKVRLIHDGVLDPEPISGVPAVHAVRLSGLMEVLPHPNFAQNQFVYLTYTKDTNVAKGEVSTTLARGRLVGKALVDVKDLLVCDPWLGDGGSGSRLAWGKDGMLYMTTGASNGNAAQEPGSLRGKILRLTDEGKAAPGNPFAGKAGYKAEIYTMGHRNSLGLALNPTTGDFWSNENGPAGGDEVNVLKPGANYGWPEVSFGRTYEGQRIVYVKEGTVPPVIFWAPSIAPSGMMFYTGDRFPSWKGNLFVGAQLGGTVPGYPHLERITLDVNQDETAREDLLLDLKVRIRDIRQGPDGLVYVATDEDNGQVIRIAPAQ
ncbi:MAG: PQQ-dependent sugar dehydrogenase [Acidobacteriota bacterium]